MLLPHAYRQRCCIPKRKVKFEVVAELHTKLVLSSSELPLDLATIGEK